MSTLTMMYSFLGEFGAAKNAGRYPLVSPIYPDICFCRLGQLPGRRGPQQAVYPGVQGGMRRSPPFIIDTLGITYLDKKQPLVASSWCALNPGLGHVMLQRILHGVFVLFWWIVVVYFSNILPALHLTFFGEFGRAREVLNPQWFLNLPSLFFFCIYTTYVNTVESNKLFDRGAGAVFKREISERRLPVSRPRRKRIGCGDVFCICFQTNRRGGARRHGPRRGGGGARGTSWRCPLKGTCRARGFSTRCIPIRVTAFSTCR